MAGKGATPSGKTTNRRKAPANDIVKAPSKKLGKPLPKGYLGIDKDGKVLEWHPATVDWWEDWRSSPQATRMSTGPDWKFMLDTALMHHTMWKTQRFELAGEVRQRSAKFGATPEDRLRIRMEIEVPTVQSVGKPSDDPNVLPFERDARASKMAEREAARLSKQA
jgi:hypothetical protein